MSNDYPGPGILAFCRYDGTGFAGWQRQQNGIAVQQVIEDALSRLARQPVMIQGAGRTDAGVHALGQAFSFVWPHFNIPGRLKYALNDMLGPRIRIDRMFEVDPTFNARFKALSKRYAYAFDLSRFADPLSSRYAWHVPYPVDLDKIRSCLAILPGKKDFAGFQSAGNQMKSTVRTLYSAELLQDGWNGARDNSNLWRIEFHGDGFLYKMVRNICGTLIEIGRGRFPVDFMREQLEQGPPFLGHCAPPHGLALVEVRYNPADYGEHAREIC
ncbi:MAG TPA: tRNA pseudouridine(38-40) synthase TruA [Candidatus Hydrogenedentes bacterium]|nr:tRNA pseudouridine(38-40) synthase TruA [Candidatus Hydrogenedentota bacterium]